MRHYGFDLVPRKPRQQPFGDCDHCSALQVGYGKGIERQCRNDYALNLLSAARGDINLIHDIDQLTVNTVIGIWRYSPNLFDNSVNGSIAGYSEMDNGDGQSKCADCGDVFEFRADKQT